MAYTPDNPYIPGDPYAYDLKWIVAKVKELIDEYTAQQLEIDDANDAINALGNDFTDLQNYVHDYFDNLDLTAEVDAILQQMYNDGYFDGIISNRNLLDNPFFTINQRGITTLTTANNTAYTVDRWFLGWNNEINITNGKPTVTATIPSETYFAQYIDNAAELAGKSAVISVIADGVLTSATLTIPTEGNTEYTNLGSVAMTSGTLRFRFGQFINGKELTAAKFELGTICTLAKDSAPNYSDELAKCRWYYRRYAIDGNRPIAMGVAANATTARLILPMDTPMRIDTPTITTLGFNVVISGGATHTVSSISAANATTGLLELSIDTTGLTTFDPAAWYTSGNEVIQISADI